MSEDGPGIEHGVSLTFTNDTSWAWSRDQYGVAFPPSHFVWETEENADLLYKQLTLDHTSQWNSLFQCIKQPDKIMDKGDRETLLLQRSELGPLPDGTAVLEAVVGCNWHCGSTGASFGVLCWMFSRDQLTGIGPKPLWRTVTNGKVALQNHTSDPCTIALPSATTIKFNPTFLDDAIILDIGMSNVVPNA